MSKGSGQSTVTTNSTTGPPQWAQNAGQSLFGQSQSAADNLKPTFIARPADLTPGQMSLFNSLMNNVGSANPAFNQAQGTLTGLQGFNAPTITPGMLRDANLDPYMSPFTKNVKDTALALGDRERQRAIGATADSAIGSGAFGGSRHGVREGVTNSEYALGAANLGANLDAQNFAQAQAAAAGDISNDLLAQNQNATNALQSGNLRLNAANSGANVAGQQQQAYLNSLFAALMGQNQIQGQNTAINQYQADVDNANNMLPYQRLQMQQGTLSGIPLAQTTTGTQTQQQPGSSLMQTLGGIVGLGSSIAGLGGPMGFGLWGAGKALGA